MWLELQRNVIRRPGHYILERSWRDITSWALNNLNLVNGTPRNSWKILTLPITDATLQALRFKLRIEPQCTGVSAVHKFRCSWISFSDEVTQTFTEEHKPGVVARSLIWYFPCGVSSHHVTYTFLFNKRLCKSLPVTYTHVFRVFVLCSQFRIHKLLLTFMLIYNVVEVPIKFGSNLIGDN